MQKLFFISFLLLALSGCSLLRPYQIEVQQGRSITRDQMQQVKPDMSQDAVSYLLGTPDFIDPYFPEVWHYVYTNQKDYLPRVQNKLVLYFKEGKLYKIEGDYPPPARLEYETYPLES
jgi:outer membrane protein assembly factor BamE (lipoprotein component of BamABCDE complex)